LNGKTVNLFGKNHILDSESFKSALVADSIDTFFTTTALFNQMVLNDTLGGTKVKNVLFGGEKADPGLVEQAVQGYPNIAFTNVYGPTETTVFASAHHFVDKVDPTIPIGKPLHNKQCYVLDADLNPVPVGLVGELYIGGLGLARGYLNRPELTAEKFVINPFYDEEDSSSSKKLYRTGDLVRWLADGSLGFIARADYQVKVRGFRIELGEIEHALTGHSEIKEAVVLAREVGDNNTQLAAYLVSSAAELQDAELIEQVRGHLCQVLPDYMVPSAFVLLAELPMTTNGKIDRSKLPAPNIEALRAEYVAPKTETEIRLSEIWQQVLGLEKAGITDSFFELGGHSLLAVKVVAGVNEAFAINFPIKTFFEHNTIEKQAKIIENNLFDEKQIVIPQRNKMISNQDELEEIEL
ncbi:non-ribosomal peptide synthetase, partial [Pseudoalteromonas luteoviolacea]